MDINNSWIVKTPIAHRGLHDINSPENSIAAFENAIKNGYAIELDVRLTDDNEIVVFHDDTLKRMTDTDGYVSNINSSNLNNYFLNKTDETIPTFKQVLDFVAGQVPILIEIKNTSKAGVLEHKLLDMLIEYSGEIAVQSFNPYSLEYFYVNAPDILRGQLSMKFKKEDLSGFLKRFALSRLMMNKISKPHFISYNAEDLPNKHVKKTKLPVLAWTVKSNDEYDELKDKCNNIIFEKFLPKNK